MPSPRLLHDTWGRTAPLLKGHGVVLQRPHPREGPPQGTQRRRGALLREMGAMRPLAGSLRAESGLGVGSALTPPPSPGGRGPRLLTQPRPEGAPCPAPPSAPHPPLPAALLSRVRCGAGRQRALVAGGSEGPGWKALEV